MYEATYVACFQGGVRKFGREKSAVIPVEVSTGRKVVTCNRRNIFLPLYSLRPAMAMITLPLLPAKLNTMI